MAYANDFNGLIQDAKQAFRRRDCAAARAIVSRMRPRARTEAQHEMLYRLQNAVRRCAVRYPALGRARRRHRRR